jgi:hypothetical protein
VSINWRYENIENILLTNRSTANFKVSQIFFLSQVQYEICCVGSINFCYLLYPRDNCIYIHRLNCKFLRSKTWGREGKKVIEMTKLVSRSENYDTSSLLLFQREHILCVLGEGQQTNVNFGKKRYKL